MMRVGYSKGWGVAFLVLAALDTATGILGHQHMVLVVAAVLALVGVLYMTNPQFVFEGGRLLIKNPLGMTLKTYEVGDLSRLGTDGRFLYVLGGGEPQKVRGAGRMMADKKEWAAFTEKLQRV